MNESLLEFKRAELAIVSEDKTNTQARGGYHNTAQINWEVDKEVHFSIKHGVLSPNSWSLLSNSTLNEDNKKSIGYEEHCQVIIQDNYCYIDLKFRPNFNGVKIGAQGNPFNEPLPMGRRDELMLKPVPPKKDKYLFLYDEETGERIRGYNLFNNRIYFFKPHKFIYADYTFDYIGDIKTLNIGERLWNGFLRLTAKMSVKGEREGEIRTGIIEIPKLKLNSSLNISLGKDYSDSTVSDFYFIGYPDEDEPMREKQKVFTLQFIDQELTGDYI